VRGPVDNCAFDWLAAICWALDMVKDSFANRKSRGKRPAGGRRRYDA
jgi:hypothetical protein